MTDTDEKYPLWCVDTLEESEDRYIGPFKTEDEAMGVLLILDGPGVAIRRCRRLKVSEIAGPFLGDIDVILETLNDNPDGGPVDAWANWNDPVVEAKPSAEPALTEWADKHLETKIFICEGDE